MAIDLDDNDLLRESLKQRQLNRQIAEAQSQGGNPLRDIAIAVGSLGYGLGTGQSAPALAQGIYDKVHAREDAARKISALENDKDVSILAGLVKQREAQKNQKENMLLQLKARQDGQLEYARALGANQQTLKAMELEHKMQLESLGGEIALKKQGMIGDQNLDRQKLIGDQALERQKLQGTQRIDQQKVKAVSPGGANLKQETSLRKEILSNKVTKDMQEVDTAFRKVKAAADNPSAAGDLSLVFGYMKMLDPGSTVREGEFANAQNAAGVPDQILNAYNKARTGERLNPTQRKDFVRQSKNLYDSQRQSYDSFLNLYRDLSKKQGTSLDSIAPKFDQMPLGVLAPKTRINVISPSGKAGSVPIEKANSLPAGWKRAP